MTGLEGKKAEQAIMRLNRVQSETACKEALIELRDVINAGMARARKAAGLGMEFPTPNSKHISMKAGAAQQGSNAGEWKEIAPNVRIRKRPNGENR